MGTSPPLFQGVSAFCVSVLRWKPFLLEIRDLWPEFAIDMGVLRNPVLIALARWLERFLYARANHIVVNSPAYRDYLLDLGVTSDKVTLIPNGVDPDMFSCEENGNGIREEWGLQDKFLIVYAGALGMANDIDTILNAADLLRDEPAIHFLFVGGGMELPRLQATSHEMQLANVTFAGPRPKCQMPAILAAADAGIATLKNIPMFRTTYPNKVFDYMAASRPTVLGIDGVIRDVVEAARAGVFVTPGDAERMADAIRSLAKDPEKAKRMGSSGREYVAENFNRNVHSAAFSRLAVCLSEKKAA
jgi:glycosyltransferase involved in cell wall biosynthesis